MTNKVKPIPDGYTSVTPYLIIKNAADAIEFYKKAFGATERMRMPQPNGKIGHAEIMMGDSVVMLSDECPEMNSCGPQAGTSSPVVIHLYVKDVDTIFNQAIAMGAKILKPVENQFYGDRMGCLIDPFGHSWSIATHIEEVSPEETIRRFENVTKQPQ
jgi:PhnB protein